MKRTSVCSQKDRYNEGVGCSRSRCSGTCMYGLHVWLVGETLLPNLLWTNGAVRGTSLRYCGGGCFILVYLCSNPHQGLHLSHVGTLELQTCERMARDRVTCHCRVPSDSVGFTRHSLDELPAFTIQLLPPPDNTFCKPAHSTSLLIPQDTSIIHYCGQQHHTKPFQHHSNPEAVEKVARE